MNYRNKKKSDQVILKKFENLIEVLDELNV